MREIDPITGQSVDYKENSDNSPPKYSSPDFGYQSALSYHADNECSKCGGTGYIGGYKHIAAGRCFECLPDSTWALRLGERLYTGTDDKTQKEKCEIRKISKDVYTEGGYVVTEIGRPPYGNFKTFTSEEEAINEAKKIYKV